VFEAGVRQVRFAFALVTGRPISPRNVERLVGDVLSTLEEFGAPGDDVEQMLDGPFADPAARKDLQNRALQRSARRLARVSPYYRELFAAEQVSPAELTIENIHHVPVTVKQTLQQRQQDFITTDSSPSLTTRTTGTTGRPTEIWLSKYEAQLWPAMAALSGLLRNEINPRDCIQINISSRATAAVQQTLSVCRLVGARTRVLGLIPPAESVESLLHGGEEAPTLLSTYPSYLAQLVNEARRRNLGPRDFRLRRIDVGGEVLSSALSRAAQETLGAPVNDAFAMTEILPLSGRVCNQGHLHQDLNMGLVEVIDLETGQPVAPGAIGTMVVTPYYPFRECMPVFRYDTRDVVRRLPAEPLTCDLAGIPGTSRILSKADQLLHVGSQVVTLRELVEVIEALPSQPWPARFSAHANDGAIDLVLTEAALRGSSPEGIERRFREAGLPVHIQESAPVDAEASLRPLRADLVETTFAARRD
jgi:phenylacetate-CoA ligase